MPVVVLVLAHLVAIVIYANLNKVMDVMMVVAFVIMLHVVVAVSFHSNCHSLFF